jgi:hypothetical protein
MATLHLRAPSRISEVAYDSAPAERWPTDTSPGRDLAFKSWQDNVAEELLFRYDQGRRGDALLTTP